MYQSALNKLNLNDKFEQSDCGTEIFQIWYKSAAQFAKQQPQYTQTNNEQSEPILYYGNLYRQSLLQNQTIVQQMINITSGAILSSLPQNFITNPKVSEYPLRTLLGTLRKIVGILTNKPKFGALLFTPMGFQILVAQNLLYAMDIIQSCAFNTSMETECRLEFLQTIPCLIDLERFLLKYSKFLGLTSKIFRYDLNKTVRMFCDRNLNESERTEAFDVLKHLKRDYLFLILQLIAQYANDQFSVDNFWEFGALSKDIFNNTQQQQQQQQQRQQQQQQQ
eukprot:Anaeramoba_flamelloidesa808013_92.p1 GENE.a808013_92~~a808013_92.p1  ORF type:complete len:279 (+),score=59.90 a808013_92:51-887(+)